MSFIDQPKQATQPASDPAVAAQAAWMSLTERLIFACPYGTSEWLRICDEFAQHYDRDAAIRRCVALAKAIASDYAHITGPKFTRGGQDLDTANVLRAHAANDEPAFRLRYGHLLPRRPTIGSKAERRTGVSNEQRQMDADAIWGDDA